MDAMSLTALASQIVAILTPFFSKVGESIATKFGEDAYEESKHLYEVVHDRFSQKDDGGRASKALQNFTDDPPLYSSAFEQILSSFLQSDPNFAHTVDQLLHTGPIQRIIIAESVKVEHTHMRNTLGKGEQTIHAGDGSALSDVSMDIGPRRGTEK